MSSTKIIFFEEPKTFWNATTTRERKWKKLVDFMGLSKEFLKVLNSEIGGVLFFSD